MQRMAIPVLTLALAALLAGACAGETKRSDPATRTVSTSSSEQAEEVGNDAPVEETAEAPELSTRVTFRGLPDGWKPAEDGVALEERPDDASPNITVHEYPVDDGATAREIAEQGRAYLQETTDRYEQVAFEQIDAFGGTGWAHIYRYPDKYGEAVRMQVAHTRGDTLFIATSYVEVEEWADLEQPVRMAIAKIVIDE